MISRTVLNENHRLAGARLIDFAGWEMPVQYQSILDEHRAVRSAVGVFDTSHMGQIRVAGPAAAAFLDRLLSNDIAGLAEWHARYSPLCADDGTIIDDLMVYRLDGDEFLVVVNASGRETDREWFLDHLLTGVELTPLYQSQAMLAIQGPSAIGLVCELASDPQAVAGLPRFGITHGTIAGIAMLAARTGYTGEDGLELFLPANDAAMVWDILVGAGAVPCGLGARDTLRLEAGLPLYGNDIDRSTTPYEAGLGWTVKLDKPDFIGRSALAKQKRDGLTKRLVGFEMIDRGIARHGHRVVDGGVQVGSVTSGTYSPTLEHAIGMAYVPPNLAVGDDIGVDIRDAIATARIVKKPFVTRG